MKTNTYLNFNGNTEEAFNFYREVFGGEFAGVMRFGDMPGCDEQQASEADSQGIMHICLSLGGGDMLMGSDLPRSMSGELKVGNNTWINISPDTKEDADRIFNSLADGGNVVMPIQDMFWGAYWGCLADRFGVQWMVNFDNNSNNQQ